MGAGLMGAGHALRWASVVHVTNGTSSKERLPVALRLLASAAFVGVGVLHFTNPAPFVAIVPPYLPAPLALVYISGVAEIAGGVGLLIPRLRRAAGIGLLLLLLAVFPANIHMALGDVSMPGQDLPTWALWARLPIQFVLAAWVWFVALRKSESPDRSRG